MTVFRPCIDLHQGRVKQIVGGSLSDGEKELRVNFVSEHTASYFASLYQKDGLRGGHVIMLGEGNESAAESALKAYPQGLQIGGGITDRNAEAYLKMGASKVIVTSWIFPKGQLDRNRLKQLSAIVGADRLVLDLSCRRVGTQWNIAINRWQTLTPHSIDADLLNDLAPYCSEFLIHAADVEGLMAGMDVDLIRHLAAITPHPMTYAGGARSMDDLYLIEAESQGRLDLTIGSALDLFGGKGAKYSDCVLFNQRDQS